MRGVLIAVLFVVLGVAINFYTTPRQQTNQIPHFRDSCNWLQHCDWDYQSVYCKHPEQKEVFRCLTSVYDELNKNNLFVEERKKNESVDTGFWNSIISRVRSWHSDS